MAEIFEVHSGEIGVALDASECKYPFEWWIVREIGTPRWHAEGSILLPSFYAFDDADAGRYGCDERVIDCGTPDAADGFSPDDAIEWAQVNIPDIPPEAETAYKFDYVLTMMSQHGGMAVSFDEALEKTDEPFGIKGDPVAVKKLKDYAWNEGWSFGGLES